MTPREKCDELGIDATDGNNRIEVATTSRSLDRWTVLALGEKNVFIRDEHGIEQGWMEVVAGVTYRKVPPPPEYTTEFHAGYVYIRQNGQHIGHFAPNERTTADHIAIIADAAIAALNAKAEPESKPESKGPYRVDNDGTGYYMALSGLEIDDMVVTVYSSDKLDRKYGPGPIDAICAEAARSVVAKLNELDAARP